VAPEDSDRGEEEEEAAEPALMAAPPPDRIVWKTSPEPTEAPAEPDGAVGPLLFLLFRLIGLVALPFLLLHPRARRHVVGLAAPDPGFVWIHGASAGEHVAAKALARVIGPEVFRTSSSWRTRVLGAFPAPLDLPFVIEPWLDRARPRLLVLVEAELWPGWIKGCERRGIPVVVVNARPGRGTDRLRRLHGAWRWLTRAVQFVPQTETGDLKLSAEIRDATFALGRAAFVAGSTREGDEEKVLAAWRTLPEPRPLLVLAPRHLARVPEVEKLLAEEKWRRRSDGFDGETEVLVLDTMGELGGLYKQARAAFIGGTFDSAVGGHSPAEALQAGLPVIRGPYAHANPAAWSAGIVLTGDLANAMRTALRLGPQAPATNAAAERAASLLPDGHTPPSTIARPLLLPVARLLVRDRPPPRQERAPIPVVSVGSLVAGGAGKTPVARWLAERIDGAWIVGRGYRRGGGAGVRTTGELGDELEMLSRAGIRVVSSPDRLAGVREAAAEGARLAILDDGFQHRRLHRDLDVVCIDARWPDGRGPIPAGEAREPWGALERADWVWVNHGPFEVTWTEPTVTAQHVARDWLIDGKPAPLSAVAEPVDVVCGVAHPEGFLSTLLRLGLEIRSFRAVGDHRPLGALAPGTVVTEKDAARLPVGAPVRVLRMDLEVDGAEPLLDAIRGLL
jgi:tetraacyldisaccharide 4'-kinase